MCLNHLYFTFFKKMIIKSYKQLHNYPKANPRKAELEVNKTP